MRYKIKRTDEEIDDVLEKAMEAIDTGNSQYRGMSYEEGLREMFDWLTSEEPEFSPLE